MGKRFPEYRGLDLSTINKEVLKKWEDNNTFQSSLDERDGQPVFVFYEGPPSANGMPGIHHVMSRTIKDVICRYKTQQGFQVHRKAGWDTHGLPVELGVEKALGITKDDIGKSISVAEFNSACREDVMKYTGAWEELTRTMGYWVDMANPYVTYNSSYIETLWWMLRQLYDKGLLYKGYSIQPYSPAAGTGLSTHELNQPGCYRDVKDTACTAQFKVIKDAASSWLFDGVDSDLFILAWTTTPWTLPSNTALAVGAAITYVKVRTFNPYTFEPVTVILAKELIGSYFNEKASGLELASYAPGDKNIPFEVTGEFSGQKLEATRYEQLIPWVKPNGDAFRVITGDFVTTQDGTGIVHIAPTFGADDDRVAKLKGIPPLVVIDSDGKRQPLVDRAGKFYQLNQLDKNFVSQNVNKEVYAQFEGRYVKNAYNDKIVDDATTLDIDLAVMLKKENKAFKVEKYVHNYPHCWRTDKPVLYYPLDSWFIKTTASRDRLIELNNTINWKPESTGSGRFGKWLENLVDWNLSRSRYWGTPLPIWRSADGASEKCIGSLHELKSEIDKSVSAGLMKSNPLEAFTPGDFSQANYSKVDLHRPHVDEIILVADNGSAMFREPDLIDVWFDSGAMPYAQVHYPFAVNGKFPFPADFIAEGVDQTRGWFFTLHALSVMLFDSVAFKNIISNGLVLDKEGNKMSKRLGNAVDPFKVIGEHGSDPLRWYMMTNCQPWDNLRFDISGVDEVKRKFFGTLYNTYSFFALYANVDGFKGNEPLIQVAERPEIDRWIISLLNSLINEVITAYENYEPTKAGRAIQDFVIEHLSNWYVRLNRKRFWGGEFDSNKIAAYQTLLTSLETVALLAAPIAPFFMDRLFTDLNAISGKSKCSSVHLALMPRCDEELINKEMETRMVHAQQISSMVLALRRKVGIKVRQPLQKIVVPILNNQFEEQLNLVKDLIVNEVNVKEIEFLKEGNGILVKKVKPNFKVLGPKHGGLMKEIAMVVNKLSQDEINNLEIAGKLPIQVKGTEIELGIDDVEIFSEDIPGWLVVNEGYLTVALDVTVTDELKWEGIARELVNLVQNLRKESGLMVTDKIKLTIARHDAINSAVEKHKHYICTQTLAVEVNLSANCNGNSSVTVELDAGIETSISIEKYV